MAAGGPRSVAYLPDIANGRAIPEIATDNNKSGKWRKMYYHLNFRLQSS
jgi:hypothetical protein